MDFLSNLINMLHVLAHIWTDQSGLSYVCRKKKLECDCRENEAFSYFSK